MRYELQKPDSRHNGQFQFVLGYSASGAEMTVHLTREQICERAAAKTATGILIDDGENLFWETEEPAQLYHDVSL